MSVIVRTPQKKIMLVCKGADSIINERLKPGQQHVEETNKQLELYAEVGLRTLLISYKYIDENFYLKWLETYKVASSSTQNREKLMADCQKELEKDLILAGCSAIEDKLQEDVG